MSNKQNSDTQNLALWKAFLIGLAIVTTLIIWMVIGQFVLKLHNPWVGLTGITMFSAAYHNNLAEAPKVWIGSLVALLMSWCVWTLPVLWGGMGDAVVLLIIVMSLGFVITQKFSLAFNFAMFMMLTAATATIVQIKDGQTLLNVFLMGHSLGHDLSVSIMKENQNVMLYLGDWLYGAVCFWLIPAAIVKIKAAKAQMKLAA